MPPRDELAVGGGSGASVALRVLIAEDEWLTATALRSQVESHGYEVVGTVGNGTEALNLCCSAVPDLVLMDVQMPGMDGLEATRALMTKSPTCVVIVTGRGQLRSEAEKAGAMCYVLKPLLNSQIPSVVEISRRRFQIFLQVLGYVQDPEEALRVWLIVRRAVEAQEEKQGVSEEDAFRLIEQRSSRDNESLLEAAEAVLAADGVA